ncbi:hypothetical protein MHK71_10145 [Kocuria indica]|nr:hypothetical protein [Kocuria indica]MCG7432845.1 hypothetical protein [Kocuria indica]
MFVVVGGGHHEHDQVDDADGEQGKPEDEAPVLNAIGSALAASSIAAMGAMTRQRNTTRVVVKV